MVESVDKGGGYAYVESGTMWEISTPSSILLWT